MELELTEEQKLVQKTAADFAKNEVLPKAAAIDRDHRHPAELVARMAELGLLGIAVPEEYGGSGIDTIAYALALEEVSRACASTGVIMSVNNSLVCDPLLKFGTEEQKREFLTPLASGKKLGCFALSEPEAGSDAAAQKTVARRDGGDWVISGVKNWITNGPVSDVCILHTMNDPQAGHKGITAFILPMKEKGVRTGPPDKKLGIRGSQSCQIFLDDVRLPDRMVLGGVGGGFKVAMTTLDGGRIGIAAQALGIARAAFEDALAYSLRAQDLRQADRAAPGHSMEARRHGHRDRRRPPAHVEGGRAQGRGCAPHAGSGDGQAVRVRGRQPRGQGGGADLRGQRLRRGLPRRAALSRREDHRDLRGHERDPAHGDRGPASEGLTAVDRGRTMMSKITITLLGAMALVTACATESTSTPKDPENTTRAEASGPTVTAEQNDAIDALFKRKTPQLMRCWQEEYERTKNRALQGDITVSMVISRAGKPGNLTVVKSTMGAASVDKCVTDEIATWVFAEGPADAPYRRTVHLGSAY